MVLTYLSSPRNMTFIFLLRVSAESKSAAPLETAQQISSILFKQFLSPFRDVFPLFIQGPCELLQLAPLSYATMTLVKSMQAWDRPLATYHVYNPNIEDPAMKAPYERYGTNFMLQSWTTGCDFFRLHTDDAFFDRSIPPALSKLPIAKYRRRAFSVFEHLNKSLKRLISRSVYRQVFNFAPDQTAALFALDELGAK
ncbi:hypothetical protein DM01DRAFT_1218816 [Hesseltinella vesiculosa]|uniref:Uncharacterized protein n=1 Tax=Hesseltinella vesiculosa TaxID=101127 RepID=A0A1X2GNX2_9FUNG|nr:hypothetical protein DM01DRAFT_1218816 [Hesseltinella vesiculosa]